jgi:hypothetical protein
MVAAGCGFTGIIVWTVKNMVAIQLMNEWKQNYILFNFKPIISWWSNCIICGPRFVVAMEVCNVSTALGCPYQTAKTLLMNVCISLAKWNIATTFICVLTICLLLTPLQASLSLESTTPQLTFCKKGSYDLHNISHFLLHTFRMCLMTVLVSTSLASRCADHFCIKHITSIVSDTHKMILYPLPQFWL